MFAAVLAFSAPASAAALRRAVFACLHILLSFAIRDGEFRFFTLVAGFTPPRLKVDEAPPDAPPPFGLLIAAAIGLHAAYLMPICRFMARRCLIFRSFSSYFAAAQVSRRCRARVATRRLRHAAG